MNKLINEGNEAVLVHSRDSEVCSPGDSFRRGDPDNNGLFDITDALILLGCQFLGTDCPTCPDSADVNDDGQVDVSDPIAHLTWRFLGGSPPTAPFTICGFDRTEDALGECSSSACDG